jgi:ABC-type cobalamin/Fe3+-siderophores transport system ATPase subunit
MQIPLFSMNNLIVKSKNIQRLYIKSFDIHRGAIYLVSGKPGSGKTTLLDTVSKKNKISNGSLFYENSDIYSSSNKSFNNELAYVSQVSKPRWFSVEYYMLQVISKTNHRKDDAKKHMNKICKQFNCSYLIDRKIRNLTPGQLRLIMLAAAIAADSKVLVIDELEQHLTKETLRLVMKILQRKSNYDGVSIIVSTLNPELISSIASVHITLSDGRITSVRSNMKRSRNRRSKR